MICSLNRTTCFGQKKKKKTNGKDLSHKDRPHLQSTPEKPFINSSSKLSTTFHATQTTSFLNLFGPLKDAFRCHRLSYADEVNTVAREWPRTQHNILFGATIKPVDCCSKFPEFSKYYVPK